MPCLYLLVGYVFVIPLIVDRQAGIWHAMELSRRKVHGQWFQLFGLLLAAGMLLFVSAAALGFGLILDAAALYRGADVRLRRSVWRRVAAGRASPRAASDHRSRATTAAAAVCLSGRPVS